MANNNCWLKKELEKLTPEERKEVESDISSDLLEMDLRELRESLGISQTGIAQMLDSTQGEVSRLERRDDHHISTVRKFVEALGGKLEIRCSLGDKQILLVAL